MRFRKETKPVSWSLKRQSKFSKLTSIMPQSHCPEFQQQIPLTDPRLYYLMPLSHCAESTAEWGRIDHSSLYRWSFLVILAMTMTMDSNSVLLMCVASAGEYKSFEHVQKFCVPSANNFHSCLCALKTCSYCLCRTAYMPYSRHSHCILCHSCM